MYSAQTTFMVILIVYLDYKGCTPAMLGLLQFISEFTKFKLLNK